MLVHRVCRAAASGVTRRKELMAKYDHQLKTVLDGFLTRFVDDVSARLRKLPLAQLASAMQAIDGALGKMGGIRSVAGVLAGRKPHARKTPWPKCGHPGCSKNAHPHGGGFCWDHAADHGAKAAKKAAPAKAARKAAKKTAPAKAAGKAKPAKPKRSKKQMPASYYRCRHPGCTNNWFPRGRPYCGVHYKLHRK
jgi:hypothetical protein